MDLVKKRWRNLVISCVINLCIGSMYAWSVFASPMEEYLKQTYGLAITAGGLAIVFTVTNMVGPVTMIFGGKINDAIGPRGIVFVGGLMFGGGMLMSGFATSVAWLIVSYGLGCGLGLGMVYGCNISNAVKLFPDKKGIVGGLSTACYGISSVIVPPIANLLNENFGITMSFKVFGVIFTIIICIGGIIQTKFSNEDIIEIRNLVLPDSNDTVERRNSGLPDSNDQAEVTAGEKKSLDYRWNEMIRTPVFYCMLIMLTCGAVSGLMCISQASAIAINKVGMSVESAAAAVSVLALFNTGGRIVAGFVSDKIGRLNTILAALLFTVAGLTILFFAGNGLLSFYCGICLIGISFGSFMGVFPAFTADQFGTKNNSVNFGVMFIGFAVAGYVGPMIMKNTFTMTGTYNLAFIFAAILAIVGIVFNLLSKKNSSILRRFLMVWFLCGSN